MKSANISSTTGFSPVMAAPTEAPKKPASEIGVSRTLSGPNSFSNPAVALKEPSPTAMFSPMRKTRGSLLIS